MSFQTTVPDGMSYVNAIYALWKHASRNAPDENLVLNTSEKVHEYFQQNLPCGCSYPYVDYFSNYLIKVDFNKSPRIDVLDYDEAYGAYAAERALDNYAKVEPGNRFDKDDKYR